MIKLAVFIFGLIIGSFLNVCIYRLPRKESIVRPRSHCVKCGKIIAWYDNIPLFSYIFLKGRCRRCKEPISFLYFIVEALTALLLLAFYISFGISAEFFIFSSLACALIIASFIDLKIQEIPDEITLPGLAIGLILGFLFPHILSQETGISGLFHSFLGALVGAGLIFAMGMLGEFLFKKEAMGGGDVKLMAMLGAFLGWKFIVLTFFLAPFFGSVVGVILKIKNKQDIMPYGPHLSLAALVTIFWGNRILGLIIF